ncbi:hypothetical protein [Burkholderia multivorans]|uniref:hypothetical protein n=1 Tax=Burkholderia multivorans TaxID=87883 RepID=UPI0021BF03F3|nr:hypothetical protein [Burkholderia multivorans]
MLRSAATEAASYLVLSQAGWFVCVLSATHRQGWIGTLGAGLLTSVHLMRALPPAKPR